MKLIIEISEDYFEIIKHTVAQGFDYRPFELIANGIPLDKIRAEIADLDDADYDYEGYYKAVTDAVKIIDKYMEGEEE